MTCRCGHGHATHCAACHRSFTGMTAFDAHRTGPYTDRRCLTVDTQPGWRESLHGWTNAEPLTAEARTRIATAPTERAS